MDVRTTAARSIGARVVKAASTLVLGTAAFAVGSARVQAADWCGGGLWVDAMLASHHIHPKQSFEDFNPGLGVECWLNGQWAVTAGGFRNSLSHPS